MARMPLCWLRSGDNRFSLSYPGPYASLKYQDFRAEFPELKCGGEARFLGGASAVGNNGSAEGSYFGRHSIEIGERHEYGARYMTLGVGGLVSYIEDDGLNRRHQPFHSFDVDQKLIGFGLSVSTGK